MKESKVLSGTTGLSLLSLFIMSVYPVVALYAINADQLELSKLLLPLSISLILSAIITIVAFLFSRRLSFSALAGVIFMALFWYYGIFWQKLNTWYSLEHWHLLPVFFVLYGHALWFIFRIKKRETIRNFSQIIMFPLLLLLIFNILKIIPQEVKKREVKADETNVIATPLPQDLKGKPDIYLFVMDEYSEFKTIQDEWGYSNDIFHQFLTENDFNISPESRSRFANTQRALPSLMNLDYVDSDLPYNECTRKYDDNYLFRFFDNIGYNITFINGWGGFGYSYILKDIKVINVYDNNLQAEEKIDPFHYLALNQSLLNPLMYVFRENNSNIFYHAHKYFFNYMENFPSTREPDSEPAFFYAHIMSPHLPFVFDREGNFIENPTNYWEYKSLPRETLKAYYLEQYIYVTKRLMEITQAIKESRKESVIIIMSDHGPRDLMATAPYYHRVLNAVYFPDKDYNQLYDSIAPINTLRVVLNKYFEQNLEMIADR